MRHAIRLLPAARRALQSLPEKIAAAAWEFIHGPLADNPHRVGKPLNEPLAPQWSARRGDYRVRYLIDDEEIVITVVAAQHRSDACRVR